MNIPFDVKNSGLLNNQVVLRYMANNNVPTEEDYVEMKKLATLDPANNYITFNSIFVL